MLRYFTFTFLFTSCIWCLNSQEFDYNIEVITAPYTPLTEAGLLTSAEPWLGIYAQLPIGFDFVLFNDTINTVYFTGFSSPAIAGNINMSPMIVPYNAELVDRAYYGSSSNSQSPVRYKIEGDIPNRIFKLEYQNAGFYYEQLAGNDDSYLNFQVWLHEENNIITYHFGPSKIVNNDDIFAGAAGPASGLIENYDIPGGSYENFWHLAEAPDDPELSVIAEGGWRLDVMDALTSHPAPNTCYRFIPVGVTSVEQAEQFTDLSIFPNPATKQIHIELRQTESFYPTEVQLFNTLGQQLDHRVIDDWADPRLVISLEELPAGLYFVQLLANNQRISKPFVKS